MNKTPAQIPGTPLSKAMIGLALFVVLLVVFSSLLAPPAFEAAQRLGLEVPFKRVFNRVLMLTAVVGAVPLAWFWNVRSPRSIGLGLTHGWLWRWACGLAIGLVTMATLAGAHVLLGHRTWADPIAWDKLPGYLAAGVLVGAIEEALFRGVFFMGIRPRNGRGIALVALAGSFFFASAHFLKAANPQGHLGWLAGFDVWGDMMITIGDGGFEALGRWTALFLMGLVLCALVRSQGSLWMAMGLHAGWIFALKTVNKLTEHASSDIIWFAADIVSGLSTIALLGAMLSAILFLGRRKGEHTHAHA
jgi:hypothetical protein